MTTELVPPEPDEAAAIRGHRAAVAGLVFCLLYLVSFAAVRGLPRSNWSNTEINDYFESSQVRYLKIVALYLVPFAGIAFLWFLAAFRDRVVRLAGTESTVLSTVQMLSGAIYVTMQFSAAASIATVPLAFDRGALGAGDIDALRPFLLLGDTILVVFAVRAAAVFMMAGTTRALRAGLFPRWFAFVSYALALVLLFTTSRFRALGLIFPLWIGAVSLMILVRRQRLLVGHEA
jgi:hypothetical protein